MIKKFFEKKHNQKDLNIPGYILFFMACYVIWQMSIIWIDANNSIITAANNLSHNFGSNLVVVCAIAASLAIIILIIKPKYAYKLCKFSTYVSLITTIFMLFTHQVELCLYILVASCSVMSLSSLAIYFYTYNSNNLKKQIFMEMLGVGIISLIFHNDIFKMSFIFYTIVSLILLILFIIGLNKISDLDIKIVRPLKKEKNKPLYFGIILIIIVCHIITIFGSNIVVRIEKGITFFYLGHIAGTLLFLGLNKIKINKTYIPSIYISIFLIGLGLILASGINLYSAVLLGITNSLYFALPYYCNLTYKNTLSNKIYIVYNIISISQVIVMDFLLDVSNNNMDVIVSIYTIISIVTLGILFAINGEVTSKFSKMLKKESKDSLLLNLSETEKTIVDLMIRDYSNNEIATTIYLSTNTVKFHIKNIFNKLEVNNRKDLIKLFE